jgi:hypothetical protein
LSFNYFASIIAIGIFDLWYSIQSALLLSPRVYILRWSMIRPSVKDTSLRTWVLKF